MFLWSRFSFGRRVQVLLFAALLPLTLFSLLTFRNGITSSKQVKLDSNRAATKTAERVIGETIASTERLLLTLALLPEVRYEGEDEADGIISSALAFYPHLSGFLAAGHDGKVFAKVPLPALEPVTVHDEDYFRYVMATGKTYVSFRQAGWISGQPVILTASPIVDQLGQPIGVLATGISLRSLDEVLASASPEGGMQVLLVDNKGRILADSGPRDTNGETPIILPSLAGGGELANGESIEYKDPLEGDRWLGSALRIPKTPFSVVAAYRADEVEGLIYPALQPYLVAPLLAIILALAVSLLLGHYIALLFRNKALIATKRVYDAIGVPAPEDISGEPATVFAAVDRICQYFRQAKSELVLAREQAYRRSLELHHFAELALRAAENERKRIARDVHDGVIQMVYVGLAQVRLSQESLSSGDWVEARTKLKAAEITLEQTLAEMRGILIDLRPPDLKSMSLVLATYQSLVKGYDSFKGGPCSFEVKGMPFRLSNDTEVAIFRIVQEALNNVAKHARATAVEVIFEFQAPELRIRVKDNGVGFDLATVHSRDSESCGLQNMRERAELIGAVLEIRSTPGQGCEMSLLVSSMSGRERSEEESAGGDLFPQVSLRRQL